MDTTAKLKCSTCGETRAWREHIYGPAKVGDHCASLGCYGRLRPTPGSSPARGIQNVLVAMPSEAADRKNTPITSGVLDYFPAALAEVARLSKAGNDQHNPGQPLNWARAKSTDHADCMVRHLIQRGTLDTDGMRHTAKVAWRALALLQEELEREAGFVPDSVSP